MSKANSGTSVDQKIKVESAKKQLDLLATAIKRVNQAYFKIVTTYDPDGIVRERVFCYELYHQLREINADQEDASITVHGEIDKRGHSDFEEADRVNPDFVFHKPGTHELNCLVVEVKGTLKDMKKVNDDFEKLEAFVQKYNYGLGLFIIFNYSLEEFIDASQDLLKSWVERNVSQSIYVLAIKKANIEAQVDRLANLKANLKH